MERYVFIAYCLWLSLGFLGVHHLYLKRYRHAFLWWSTAGGFILGWLREFYLLSDYVHEYKKQQRIKTTGYVRSGQPPFSFVRFAGAAMTGLLYSTVVYGSLHSEWITDFPILKYSGCIGTAVGVHLVSNVGKQSCSWTCVLVGSFLVIPLSTCMDFKPDDLLPASSFLSAFSAYWWGTWKKPSHTNYFKAIFIFSLCGALYVTLWTSFVLNITYVDERGHKVKLREHVENYFDSPEWLEMKQGLWGVWDAWWMGGWLAGLEETLKLMDPGEDTYEILGVSRWASEREISAAYKRLMREWHPDKHRTDRHRAETMSRKINMAYDQLSSAKHRRAQQNSKPRNGF